MKHLLILLITVLIFSCKPCRECKYSTLKDTYVERSCSSIRADLDAFEAEMDSIAKFFGSEAICTKESY